MEENNHVLTEALSRHFSGGSVGTPQERTETGVPLAETIIRSLQKSDHYANVSVHTQQQRRSTVLRFWYPGMLLT